MEIDEKYRDMDWKACLQGMQLATEANYAYVSSVKYGHWEVQYYGDDNWYQDTTMNPTTFNTEGIHAVRHVRFHADKVQRWLLDPEGFIKHLIHIQIPSEAAIKDLDNDAI